MGIKKRFSLTAVFVVTTVVALLFGYGQWRRIRIGQMVDELQTAGVVVHVPDRWWAIAWPLAPQAAELRAEETTGGQFKFGESTYNAAEANERIALLRRRLKSLGFKRFLVDTTSPNGSRQQLFFDLDAGEETNRQHRLNASSPATDATMGEFLDQLRVQNAPPASLNGPQTRR
jgi:hypothetical protein